MRFLNAGWWFKITKVSRFWWRWRLAVERNPLHIFPSFLNFVGNSDSKIKNNGDVSFDLY